jgi:hypothetical protein
MTRSHEVAALIAVTAIVLLGCERRDPANDNLNAASAPAAQLTFDTPEDAITALLAALESNDPAEWQRLLGPQSDALISSGDEVADRAARNAFIDRYREHSALVAGGPGDVVLQVGEDGWPFPIPLAKDKDRWRFDAAAGAQELLARRIGRNELQTIDVMRGYVVAQEEYAARDHDGVAAGTYAQKLRSDPGLQNGLYWEAAAGEAESPAGPFLAAAAAEGYTDGAGTATPYYGYLYRPLLAQGPSADGGALEYVVDGTQTGGFALLAYPANYGVSGVMTFIVNENGVVWQRDLGEETPALAAAIATFDPDSSWTPIAPEE